MQFDLSPQSHLLVLTGAGVSAESGIPTFRDAGGLWEGHAVEQVASPQGFAADPALVWRFYSLRRQAASRSQPNPGHRAIAGWEQRLGERFLLVTQNIDDLHPRAGSTRLLEIHGNLFRTRCSRCHRAAFRDECLHLEGGLPRCTACTDRGRDALLRPDIVWFGEMLDPGHMAAIEGFVERARANAGRFYFVAVGTSGLVYPAAGLVALANRAGAATVLVNRDPAANTDSFRHFVQAPAGTALPTLFKPT